MSGQNTSLKDAKLRRDPALGHVAVCTDTDWRSRYVLCNGKVGHKLSLGQVECEVLRALPLALRVGCGRAPAWRRWERQAACTFSMGE